MAAKVSVCMASYNHAPFIRAAVESVLNQTVNDWELVITDDGSSDGTIEALDGICDERIRIERFPENRSACVALNHCIRRARGQYIAVLNSDDAWRPEKLARQLAVMGEQPETAAVFTLVDVIDERGGPMEEQPFYKTVFNEPNRDRLAWLRRLVVDGNCLCHPSVLVRTEVYRDLGLYDECMAQLPDLDMWIRICLRHGIWIIQEPLTLFRVFNSQQNASGNRQDVRIRCQTEMMLIFWKLLATDSQQMAAILDTPSGTDSAASGQISADTLTRLLGSQDISRLQPAMQAGAILWMHGQIEGSEDWATCKRFIAKTAEWDAFNARLLESMQARIEAQPQSRWQRALSRLGWA
jgi:hypothetical protein